MTITYDKSELHLARILTQTQILSDANDTERIVGISTRYELVRDTNYKYLCIVYTTDT